MNESKTTSDETIDYRAQFERNMASITAKQDKAEAEIAAIRAILSETSDIRKETSKIQKETKAILRENAAQLRKTEAVVSKNASKVNSLDTRWSRFVDSLVEGGLVGLLNGQGIEVQYTSKNLKRHYDRTDGTRRTRQIDIVAENDREVVVVEVKTTLSEDDVERFVGTMGDIARYFPRFSMNTVYGAVAYIHCEGCAREKAESEGLYVIRATGDSARIVNDDKFRPVSFTDAPPPPRHLRAVPDG